MNNIQARSWGLFVGIAASTTVASAAGVDMGINLLGANQYDTSAPWADVSRLFSNWGMPDASWTANPNLTYTPDGYPLQDAGLNTAMSDYPDGVYKLSFNGTATVNVNWLGALSNLQRVGNTTTADVTINRAKSNGLPLAMKFTNISPTDPLDNLHLMAPNTTPAQVFLPQYVNRLQPFSTLRFMDWTHTNGNNQQNWSDRIQPGSYPTTNNGVAWEDVASLANATGKDAWINVPTLATDDYVHHLAQLLHASVTTGKEIYVEYSNELWNAGFTQEQQVVSAAAANPLLTDTDAYGRGAQQAALRTKQIGDIFKQEFGTDASRIKVVLGGQAAWTYFASEGLKYLQATFGNVSNSIDAVAFAPYVSPDSSLNLATATVDQVFQSLNKSLDTTVTAWIQADSQLTHQYGLPMLSYEGGQSIVTYGTNQAVMTQAENDPRMGALLTRLESIWQQNGGAKFMPYGFIAPGGAYGFWGALDEINQKGSEKWDAMMRMILPAGDADLNGTVNAADLTILLAHFGQSAQWWEQGDFNGDHLVNADDLVLFDRTLAQSGEYRLGAMIVPEPATLATTATLLSIGGLLRRRRR